MKSIDRDGSRKSSLALLKETGQETRRALFRTDPERPVYGGVPPWHVRDILGHIGAWNLEAARALVRRVAIYNATAPLPALQGSAAAKVHATLGWVPTLSFEQLVTMMVDADLEMLQKK